jgi:adenylosuccinate synthase
VTKLDVLDGVETLQLGIGYRLDGERRDLLPFGAEALAGCEPIYEEIPGWSQSTVGLTRYDELPQAAQRYLQRIEAICEVPVDMISTGAEREQTIVRRHPFKD